MVLVKLLDTTQKQLASGHRFSRPGEDPAAMSRLVRIERYEGDLERYRSNIDFGEGMINTANDAYQAIIEVLNDARTTANMMADLFQMVNGNLRQKPCSPCWIV